MPSSSDVPVGAVRASPIRPAASPRALVETVLHEPGLLRMALQPIVSVQEQGIVGYEALARFEVPDGPDLPPDLWFAEAAAAGLEADLEALAITTALRWRADLPVNTFLTVNLSPHLVIHPAITAALRDAGDLSRVVVEITERSDLADHVELRAFRDEVERHGGFLALDDTGAGYSGLRRLAEVRPHFLKLDRDLLRDVDRDEVKRVMIELLGELGNRLDAWLLAEGVETWAELEVLAALGVPLVQGYLLGAPQPPFATLDPDVQAGLATFARVPDVGHTIAGLVERSALEETRPSEPGVRVDPLGRPAGLLLPRRTSPHPRRVGDDDGRHLVPVTLVVRLEDTPAEVAHRMIARPDAVRFDPAVCVDGQGRAVGSSGSSVFSNGWPTRTIRCRRR